MSITLNAKRKRRLMMVGLLVIGVGIAAALALTAFRENILYFYSPTEVLSGEAPVGHKFRLGGLVVEGSVKRETDGLTVHFGLTDTAKEIPVMYSGILPDLFREGQGIVAHGRLNEGGIFVADEVLAKHDENYMPPEVAEALKDAMPGNESLKHPGM
jgi:cytochrome c-type biogenesis protein CcmE